MLPVPAGSCVPDECEVFGPQFVGRTGFLVIDRAPATPYFLVSQDLGVRQGRFAELETSFDFVSPSTGFAWVSGGGDTPAGAPPMDETTDSGRTWTSFTPVVARG
jgi:hypothetical protein